MTEMPTPSAVPGLPLLLDLYPSDDGKEVLFHFWTGEYDADGEEVTHYAETDREGMTAVFTGEAPIPRALLITFHGDTESARFLFGVALEDIMPDLKAVFPDLPAVHPAQLADHLRKAGKQLTYPVAGLPDTPAVFPSLEAYQENAVREFRDTVETAAERLASGEGGEDFMGRAVSAARRIAHPDAAAEPLGKEEIVAGAALLMLMRSGIETLLDRVEDAEARDLN